MKSGNNRRQFQAIAVAALMLTMAITGVTQDVSGVESMSQSAKIRTTSMNDAGLAGGKALMKASFRVDASDVSTVGEGTVEMINATTEDADGIELITETADADSVEMITGTVSSIKDLFGREAAEALDDAEKKVSADSEEELAEDANKNEAAEEVDTASEESEETELVSIEEIEFPENGDAVCGNSSKNNSADTINWNLRVMADIDDYLKVRKSADGESEVVGKMEKGDVGVIVGVENGWIHMISGDLDGYMNAEYCVVGDDAQNLAEELCDVVAVTNTQGLRIRESAEADGKVIRTLDKDTKLKVVSEEQVEEEYDADEWVPVKDGSKVGFVSAEYVDVVWNLGEGMTREEEIAIQKEKEEAAAKGIASKNTSDAVLIAALIQAEGNGQPYEGKVAIANVVMNRVHSGGYPNSVHGVIYQRGQFGPALTGKVARIVAQGPSQTNINAATAAITGTNYIGGCTHFKGVASGAQGIVIGGHVFY